MQIPKLFSSLGSFPLTRFRPSITVTDSLGPYIGIGGVRHTTRGRIITKVVRKDTEGTLYKGFRYYPRFPDQKDPPYEPTKLFRLQLISRIRGIPYWERYICAIHLHLEKVGDVTIVKNTPNTNALLYKVKHLIRINPITYPHGFPPEGSQGYLDEHGRYYAYNLLPDVQKGTEEVAALKKREMGGEVLKERLKLRYYSRWD